MAGAVWAAPLHPGRIGTESTRCNIQLHVLPFTPLLYAHTHTHLHWSFTVHRPPPPCQQVLLAASSAAVRVFGSAPLCGGFFVLCCVAAMSRVVQVLHKQPLLSLKHCACHCAPAALRVHRGMKGSVLLAKAQWVVAGTASPALVGAGPSCSQCWARCVWACCWKWGAHRQ